MDIVLFLVTLCLLYQKGYAQCKPDVPYPSADVAAGGTVFLRCNIGGRPNCNTDINVMEYHKRPNKNYSWKAEFRLYPNETGEDVNSGIDYDVFDRAFLSVSSGDYDLSIENEAILADGGDWMCVYKGNNGDTYESDVISVNVTAPCDVNIQGPPYNEYFLFDKLYTYICSCSPTSPEINPIWRKGDIDYTGVSENTLAGYVWNIKSRIELSSSSVDEVNVTCIMRKTGGTAWSESDSTMPDPMMIKAPPSISDGTSNGPIQSSLRSTLELNCTACGSNISVEWYRNNKMMLFPNDLFEIVTDSDTYNCPYGQNIRTVSTLIWKPPTSSSNTMCSKKTKHDGTYSCAVRGFSGSTDTSKDMIVNFFHTNACISDGGLAGIIIGTLILLALVIVFIVFGVKKCNSGPTQ